MAHVSALVEAGDQLADGAEGEAGQIDKLALGHELPRAQIACQKVASEAAIGLFAKGGGRAPATGMVPVLIEAPRSGNMAEVAS